jgi:hypothetical protein
MVIKNTVYIVETLNLFLITKNFSFLRYSATPVVELHQSVGWGSKFLRQTIVLFCQNHRDNVI